MNTPIISPWVIYLLDMLDPMRTIFISACVLLVCASAVYLFVCTVECRDVEGKLLARALRWLAVLVVLCVLIPSSSTCTKMLVVSQITPANIEVAKQAGVDVVDYLTEKLTDVIDSSKGVKDEE